MKITVDVGDFWIEEGELNEALETHVKNQVITQIGKSIEDKVQTVLAVKIKETIDKKIEKLIQAKLDDLVNTGKIIIDRNERTIVDHVKHIFENNVGWHSPREQIASLAKKFGDQLKAGYDAAFANRIVQALNEQGMLKDEVVKLLIK